MSKTIGILTGGGDCPGLNAVIRGVVRSAILTHGWKVVGIRDGFEGLVGELNTVELGLNEIAGILPRGGTIIGTTNRGNPFSFPVERDGKIVQEDVSDTVIENFKKVGIDALIVVGGDGTLKIAAQLHAKGLPVVGIPKTIDNDLSATDVTFGYNTAVEVVMESLDRLHTTAESHHRALVVEVMGRDAGWIALEAGIAGGAHVILLPEIPFSFAEICAALRTRLSRGRHFSIIVVAEGAVPTDGDKVLLRSAEENLGVERLGGVGASVAEQISTSMGMETRHVVLGHLQRGGSPTSFDRILGSRFGVHAVEMIATNQFGRMCALRGRDILSVSLDEAIGQLNRVDPHGDLVRTAERLGINLGR